MAKTNKPESKSTVTASTSNINTNTKASVAKHTTPQGKFMFDQMNYMLLMIGLIVLVIGFVAMTGGADHDPSVFSKAEKFSFRRVTLAPILILLGFGIQIVAIFYRSATPSESSNSI
jgi:Protein of unknown function (DUF3098)